MVKWSHPLEQGTRIEGPKAEVTPFAFRGRLYSLENFVPAFDHPGKEHTYRFGESGFRIRDVAEDRVISIPLLNCYFAAAYVWDDRVYVYTGVFGVDPPSQYASKTVMLQSDDLITWSKPEVVMAADPEESFFNYGVCRARGKFYLLYETNDPRWPKFTMRFCESDDLTHWRKLTPEYIYGTDKYTGGPALYFDEEEDYFYLLYVNDVGRNYDTRIARSRDLISWEDAAEDRVVLTFDNERDVDPINWPGVKECSSSDIEMCEFGGKTHIYWISGNQQGACVEYREIYDGSMVDFLRVFF